MQHQLWLLTLGDNLYLAPINPNPHHVLDLGTGTGIWAIDFGNRLSFTEVKYY
jgi:methylase of polypeptide subunit release factors